MVDKQQLLAPHWLPGRRPLNLTFAGHLSFLFQSSNETPVFLLERMGRMNNEG